MSIFVIRQTQLYILQYVVYLHVILLYVSAVHISCQQIGYGYTKSKELRRGLSLQTVGVNLL